MPSLIESQTFKQEKRYTRQQGSALTLVLGISVVIGIVMYFLFTPLQNQKKVLNQDLLKKRLEIIILELGGVLQNDMAWEFNIEQNPQLTCLRTNSCPDQERPLDLFTLDGRLINNSSDIQSGYRLSGELCPSGQGFDPNSESWDCPFQVRLFWSPNCQGCRKQEAKIRAEVKTNRILNFSTERLAQKLTFTRSQYTHSIDQSCAQMGGRYNQSTAKCEFFFQERECGRGRKLAGITDDNQPLCIDIPAIEQAPCSFAGAGFTPQGDFICM